MLIKMMSRPLSKPDLEQLISYINQKRKTFDDEPNFIIRYNTNGKNCKEVADDFIINNTFIKQGKGKRNGVIHIVLSWHKKEQHLLNDAILFDFGKKFCDLINGDNSLIFLRPHYDKEAIHLHIAQSASLLGSQRSTRISKARLKEIQIEMNRYQQTKYKDLKHSLLYLPELEKQKKSTLTGIPLPTKMKEVDGSIRAKKRGQKSMLEILKTKLIEVAKNYPNKKDFLNALEIETEFSVYLRNNKATGIITDTGKKFRFSRLSFEIENLQKTVRLHELERLKKRNQERYLER